MAHAIAALILASYSTRYSPVVGRQGANSAQQELVDCEGLVRACFRVKAVGQRNVRGGRSLHDGVGIGEAYGGP